MAANPIPEAVRAQAAAWFAEYDKANHFPEMLATDAYAAGYAAALAQQPAAVDVVMVRRAYQQAFLRQGHGDALLTMLEQDVEAALATQHQEPTT